MDMRLIIFYGLIVLFVVTGCNHHVTTESLAQLPADASTNNSSELPSVAEIVALEEDKFLVGGWVMGTGGLKAFIDSLPQETEVVVISNEGGISLKNVEQMLDERGVEYTLK